MLYMLIHVFYSGTALLRIFLFGRGGVGYPQVMQEPIGQQLSRSKYSYRRKERHRSTF